MSSFQNKPEGGDNDWTKDDSDESVADEEVNDESDENDDKDGDSITFKSNTGVISATKGSKGKVKNAPLSKKEKAAMKAKEMADMDDVFAEFGIDIQAVAMGERTITSSKDGTSEESSTFSTSPEKKKKRKKKIAPKPATTESTTPAIPLSKEEIKAKLSAKAAAAVAKAKPKVSIAVSAALKGGGDGKVQSKSEIKKAKALDWER